MINKEVADRIADRLGDSPTLGLVRASLIAEDMSWGGEVIDELIMVLARKHTELSLCISQLCTEHLRFQLSRWELRYAEEEEVSLYSEEEMRISARGRHILDK